jgi:hypothetical protein
MTVNSITCNGYATLQRRNLKEAQTPKNMLMRLIPLHLGLRNIILSKVHTLAVVPTRGRPLFDARKQTARGKLSVVSQVNHRTPSLGAVHDSVPDRRVPLTEACPRKKTAASKGILLIGRCACVVVDCIRCEMIRPSLHRPRAFMSAHAVRAVCTSRGFRTPVSGRWHLYRLLGRCRILDQRACACFG